jgi:CDP-glycerol glycerophosphotransferase (TagB/SpsB family)
MLMREIAIELYLFCFKVLFAVVNRAPLQNKITFIDSFGQNSLLLYDELVRMGLPCQVVFLHKPNCRYKRTVDAKVITFEGANPVDFIRSVYHIATSRYLLIDNYYAFLSVVKFKPGVQCIQLWHAAGAIKKFGLFDESTKYRSKRARKRFVRVYQQFHKVVVGSDAMAEIFMKAFNLSQDHILRTGYPRTDIFYDTEYRNRVVERLKSENEVLKRKKVILYAPTYRDGQLSQFELKLDFDLMHRELGNEYVLLLRLHPAVRKQVRLDDRFAGFVYDYSGYKDVNDLLFIADCLITDYSSIIYEYALLNRPIIFYAYDLEHYSRDRGLWNDYRSMMPGPVVRTTEELVQVIKQGAFDLEAIREFSRVWNQYSVGRSCKNLVEFLQRDTDWDIRRRQVAADVEKPSVTM